MTSVSKNVYIIDKLDDIFNEYNNAHQQSLK